MLERTAGVGNNPLTPSRNKERSIHTITTLKHRGVNEVSTITLNQTSRNGERGSVFNNNGDHFNFLAFL
jgi:hypothetical protein